MNRFEKKYIMDYVKNMTVGELKDLMPVIKNELRDLKNKVEVKERLLEMMKRKIKQQKEMSE